jgi:hypothetical protein
MKYVFWMLEVTSSLWFMCNCWKMSPWNREYFSLFPQESSQIGHACAKYSWDGSLFPPSSWKFPICTTSHWLIYSRTKKSPRPSLSSFTFSQQGLGCVSMQEAPAGAIIFWQSQSCLFGALHYSPYLENLATLSRWHPLKLSIRTYWV